MNRLLFTLLALSAAAALHAQGLRREETLSDWQFRNDHDFEQTDGWQSVTVPHDWAICGPFSRENDLQEVAVIQNGETASSLKTGRTGGLPYVGKGCYRRTIPVDTLAGRRYVLLFDGAMSEARVLVNGREVCFWPYGYSAFSCEITQALHVGENQLVVLLENRPQSSRWYPGAGLYREVKLLTLAPVHVPVWGVQVLTPYVGEDYASVTLRTKLDGVKGGEMVEVETAVRNAAGEVVAAKTNRRNWVYETPFEQHLTIERPALWSPESPALYTAESTVRIDGVEVDRHTTRFGIRTVEVRADKGFFLNGELRRFKGVCLHHDLGPLGAAVNRAALRHQLTMLRDMGCNAIRTSHNMPAEELVELCDEMGFMVMVEPFDEWDVAKCANGYHRYFREWAERDMVAMLHHFRNNPSVVMWSVGNEVPSQWEDDGYRMASWLQEICHREDPTRPVTCGMDQVDAVLSNGFAAIFDVPGLNYRVHRYREAYDRLPQSIILGSETASTVSSRGVYHFPVEYGPDRLHDDHQSSGYDVEFCGWSNVPDDDFAAAEDLPWLMGQFVWTGFDYLGEPTPYHTDAWPNHSSMFGIIDLASLPKDRYWLYRSVWNTESPTLHVLPHWNWPGREGEITPVYVYTSYPSAELFINGRSQGIRTKNRNSNLERYRLMWNEVRYEPGEVRVVAYDAEGRQAAERIVRTPGKPWALRLSVDRKTLAADGRDLAYVTVGVVDRAGNPVPTEHREVRIEVAGAGHFRAVANGDPTSLESFCEPHMHLFNGLLTAIVGSGDRPGELVVKASARGLKSAELRISVQ
ncbi:glycoside hydrolase family 2 TIM barrel-domain containing protein [uncultured Alistipes sp.]|uniref:glycoside hydrolase family 2 TIM barrel-domain containing protein n=1 Tax=uncultured Alistipes sp. TaxID=538949 RepID=UPI0026197046|nr:glycoside hydrolase family 2 TIM barrel-domain containing protein [uncultured Alistipes sp.]